MIFRRKQEEDEDEKELDKKNSKSDSIKTKTRKKKEEAFKPWTKKERILVFSVLAFTVLTSAILAMSARSWKLPNLPRLTLPSFNFFKGETIYLSGNPEDDRKTKEVTSQFREVTDRLTGVYGLFVVRLDNGSSYGVNEKETFQAASLIKLPVMVGMYLEEEKGNLDLDDKYKLRNEDKVAGAGSLYGKEEGSSFTYRELIEYMAKQSDNTAYKASLNLLGEDKVREIIKEIGMVNTSFDENETTPEDIALLFKKLMAGELISSAAKDELIGFLTDTIYEEWLAAGVPTSIDVAHKYGREIHVVNDAGVVFTENPFVVVIMSKGVVEREADEVFPNLSKLVYEIEKD